MSHTARRINRVNWIRKLVVEANARGKVFNYDELIGMCMNQFGASRRTCIEYIQGLIYAKEFVIELDEVWTKRSYEAQKVLEDNQLNTEEKLT